jgi:hypothetical protein
MTPEQELAALRDAVKEVVPVLLMAVRQCTAEQSERVAKVIQMVTTKGAK